jgi:ribosomal protein L37AE/L43A
MPYKGSTGSSMNFDNPTTKQQRTDRELYKQSIKNNLEHYKAYRCPKCNSKLENPPKTEAGLYFCSSCMISHNQLIIVKEIQSYRLKDKKRKR